jgi:Xaa-Pro aminopeptidase
MARKDKPRKSEFGIASGRRLGYGSFMHATGNAANHPSRARPARGLPPAEHAARIRRLLAALKRRRLDGAVITSPVARFYYTGVSSSAGALWVDVREGPLFVVDFRYIFMARAALPFMPCALQKPDARTQPLFIKRARRWRRCGYEGREPAAHLKQREARLPNVTEWEDVDSLILAQRAIKSLREQRALRRAIAANDALLAALLPQIRVGQSEWEIRNIIRREADRLGQGEAFDTIACAGANAAECHHVPGGDVLEPNQPLLLDFGVKLDHYCADMTRCISFGRTAARYRELHRIVLEANRRAIAAIRPGMTGQEVDAVARASIKRAGYGTAFGHGLGHGIGLEVHESPAFSPRSQEVIRPGMAITVEPGIYLSGKAGIRIEDVVLITRAGCEVLTRSPRWIERPNVG